MDVINPLEKILDLAIAIKELVEFYKGKDKWFENCQKYINSVLETMSKYKDNMTAGEKTPQACYLLEAELEAFKVFLEKEKKRSVIMNFFRKDAILREGHDLMSNVMKQMHNFNLALSIQSQNKNRENFNKLLTQEIFSSNGIINQFSNKEAGMMWVRYFNQEEQVTWKAFGLGIKEFAKETEKIELDDVKLEILLLILDKDQNYLIRFDEWEEFYIAIWSDSKNRSDLLNSPPIIAIKPELQFNPMILQVCAINKTDQLANLYPLKHLFTFTVDKINYFNYENKEINKNVNWYKESVIFGKERVHNANEIFKPDICFKPEACSINTKQFQISYKKFISKESGFYINNLSGGAPTCLKIEDKPFVVEPGMLFMLSDNYLIVEDISPPIHNIDPTCAEFYHIGLEFKEDDLTGNKVTDLMPKKVKKPNKNAQNEKSPEKSKKKQNKDFFPSIKVKLMDSSKVQETICIQAKKKKEPMNIKIGSDEKCEVLIKDLTNIQMKLKFSYINNLWFAVTDEDCIQKNEPQMNTGNYLVLMEAEDFLKGEEAASNSGTVSVRLQTGMKIGFDYNELEVLEDGR